MSKNQKFEEEKKYLLEQVKKLVTDDIENIPKAEGNEAKNCSSFPPTDKLKFNAEKYDISAENFIVNTVPNGADVDDKEKDKEQEKLNFNSGHVSVLEEDIEDRVDKSDERSRNTNISSEKGKEGKKHKVLYLKKKKHKDVQETSKKDQIVSNTQSLLSKVKDSKKSKLSYLSDYESESKLNMTQIVKKDNCIKNLSDREKLSHLVKKEGFPKVFNCLTFIKFNRNNPLERKIEDIVSNIGLLRTTLILLQINMQSNNSTNFLNNSFDKFNYGGENNESSINSEEDIDILIDGIGLPDNTIKDREVRESVIKNKTNNKRKEALIRAKSALKDLGDKELSYHLHKEKDGKIYKYNKHYCRGPKSAIYCYYCADRKCNSKANYYAKTMRFEVNRGHNIEYEEHCYIKNKYRADKYRPIMKEFAKRDCHEAQVFNKGEEYQEVKWYD